MLPTTRSTITAALVVAAVNVVLAAPATASAVTATIDATRTFQTIDGFGASEFFGQSGTLMNLAGPAQTQALDLLFSPTKGAGLTILRNGIGDAPGSTIEPT